ncbi:hypothetical protein BJ684DRAFT_18856 [Piptocephalis cylindrospora]|uniref:Phospholipid/glycerol acyltransferase domain-containing protein n=1 Tax=Piptocephalis cylindrospora TaxID=1907219 RepID=A0A4P9Y7P6_9FUNG|nr:hypothetical protein BJ684DRAFT_18856 [Piptocephalis cylindrospora]|eukprot:RKP14774.1 hypothetical protein BJ684DRAFT_18856 [Piptocephalis cylindrospora]
MPDPTSAQPKGTKNPPPVYRLLRLLFRLSLHAFYNTIVVRHQENLPPDGVPSILCPNHSNSLTDGVLMVTSAPRQRAMVRMTAKDTLWDHWVFGWFIRSVGTVPLQRRQDHPGPTDNTRSVNEIIKALTNGDCVCIFPEGISRYHASLAPVRRGVATMALSTLKELEVHGKEAKVCIVPCGVTYLHRHRFRSSLLVDYGEPIVPSDASPWMPRTGRRYGQPRWPGPSTPPPDILVSLGTHVDMTRLFLDAFAAVARSDSTNSSISPLPKHLPSDELCALRDDLLEYRNILKGAGIGDGLVGGHRAPWYPGKRAIQGQMIIRLLMTAFFLILSLPGLCILSPMLILTKAKERKVLARPGAEEQNLDEVAQYKMLIALGTLIPIWGLFLYLTGPYSLLTALAVPAWWWLSIRWCEDGMASARAVHTLRCLLTLDPALLESIQERREALRSRVLSLSSLLGLPDDPTTLEDETRSGPMSRLRWFDVRGRRIRDWEEVLRPYDVEEDM